MATVLGEKSRTEAIRETIAEMSKKGIPAFVDKTGREWSPEAYVDMDIRNTAKNAALAAEFASLDDLGQDIVLVSSHSGSRPLCAPYQGKFYSISGKSGTITDAKGKTFSYTPLSETSYGEAAGLFGINCGHRMRGVSEGTFINREKEFDGEETSEEYRKVQRQRAMEREVRKKKTEANMLEAAGDKDAARDLRRLAADENRKLQDYCEKEGLYYRQDRTEVYGYNKVVDKSKKSGIINKTPKKLQNNFTTAQSIEEAMEYAEKFLGFDYRQYEKFNLDVANMVNYEISKGYDVFGNIHNSGFLDGVMYYPKKSSWVAAYSPSFHTIYMKNVSAKNSLMRMAKQAREQFEVGFWSDSAAEHAIRHEFGHAVQHYLTDNNAVKLNKITLLRESVLKKCEIEKWDINDTTENMKKAGEIISYYALRNDGEMIAESVAEFLNGNPRDTAKKVIEILLGKGE